MSSKINYTGVEKDLLLQLVEQQRDVIESKKNDGATIQLKERAWTHIHHRYNSRRGVTQRTRKQLKNLWKNLKAKAKKDVSTENQTGDEGMGRLGFSSMGGDGYQANVYGEDYEPHLDVKVRGRVDERGVDQEDESSISEDTGQLINSSDIRAPSLQPAQSQDQPVALRAEGSSESGPSLPKMTKLINEDRTSARLLELAEEEHKQKMKIYKLKEEILQLQKEKVLKELGHTDKPV